MAEVMQRMADQAGLDLQATERKLCEKLNSLAAALLASAKLDSTSPSPAGKDPTGDIHGDEPMDTQGEAAAGPSKALNPGEDAEGSPEPSKLSRRKRKAAGRLEHLLHPHKQMWANVGRCALPIQW